MSISYNVFHSYSPPILSISSVYPSLLYTPIFVSFTKVFQKKFVLLKYSCMCGLLPEGGWLTRSSTQRESSLFLSQQLWPIAPWPEVGLCVQLPLCAGIWSSSGCSDVFRRHCFYSHLLLLAHRLSLPPLLH